MDIYRKNVERLERALKAAIDESERNLKLIEEKRAKLNNGPLGDLLGGVKTCSDDWDAYREAFAWLREFTDQKNIGVMWGCGEAIGSRLKQSSR